MSQQLEALPPGWGIASLGEVCDVNVRGFLPASASGSMRVVFVPMAAVSEEFGGIDITATRPLQEVVTGYTSFVEGDVLFAKITPCMENGKLAVVPPLPSLVGFGSTEFHVLRSGESVAPQWLAYFLSQREFRRAARQDMSGSAGQLRVQTGWLSAARIPLAPVNEQRRIVDAVEVLLSELDAGVRELQAAQKKLTQYRQSLLKAAVVGALTAEWRAQNPPQETGAELLARILRERRAHATARRQAWVEPEGPSQELKAALPTGWCWASVDQLSNVIRGASPRPAGDPRYFGGKIPWITVGSLTAHEGKYLERTELFVTEDGKARSRWIGPDTLLLTNSGATLGVPKITRIGGCINDGSVALLGPDEPLKSYLYWFLRTQTSILRATNQGAAQPNLNTGIVRRIEVPLPPLAEQQQIVACVQAQVEAVLVQGAAIDRGLRLATAQRQNILRAAFSGQLVPQDPNDEPASALLERIAHARSSQQAVPKRRRARSAKEPA